MRYRTRATFAALLMLEHGYSAGMVAELLRMPLQRVKRLEREAFAEKIRHRAIDLEVLREQYSKRYPRSKK